MAYFADHSSHCRSILQFHHVADPPQTQASQTGFVVGKNPVRALDLLHFYSLGSHYSNLEKNFFCLDAPPNSDGTIGRQPAISSTDFPRLAAMSCGERMFFNPLNVARTTFTGLVEP